MLTDGDPEIEEATLFAHFNDSYEFDINNNHFQMAFIVETAEEGYPRIDPAYVEWDIFMREKIIANLTKIPLRFHTCTDEDFSYFNKPAQGMEKMFEFYK